ncbi:DUF7507 domain-containing protein [Roseinatronobacter monicus]|uniref:Putative repeat protein (TIGR01451 family) n=1 Tax=Roseinatronobacter monicus TaxID=393481 RepID=A0A543K8U5_9RHOB|nr:DUF11 domain-containing protein [Roseinatronobacter monicus]TQM91510.1 putative repeat protein (TIGR01451 family) [Roseinatronobacter monicus]
MPRDTFYTPEDLMSHAPHTAQRQPVPALRHGGSGSGLDGQDPAAGGLTGRLARAARGGLMAILAGLMLVFTLMAMPGSAQAQATLNDLTFDQSYSFEYMEKPNDEPLEGAEYGFNQELPMSGNDDFRFTDSCGLPDESEWQSTGILPAEPFTFFEDVNSFDFRDLQRNKAWVRFPSVPIGTDIELRIRQRGPQDQHAFIAFNGPYLEVDNLVDPVSDNIGSGSVGPANDPNNILSTNRLFGLGSGLIAPIGDSWLASRSNDLRDYVATITTNEEGNAIVHYQRDTLASGGRAFLQWREPGGNWRDLPRANFNSTPPFDTPLCAPAEEELTHVKSASLDDTVAGTDGVVDEGDEITYTFTLENTGDVDLTNVSVVDDANFSGTGTLPTPTLNGDGTTVTTDIAIGESATFSTTYTLTQADIDEGEITNQALASADELDADVVSDTGTDAAGATITDPLDTDSSGSGATNDDPTVLTLTAAPALTLEKSADTSGLSSPAVVGELITYTFSVENTGNVTLNNVAVNDPLPDLSEPVFDAGLSTAADASLVAPGETAVFTATYALKQSDIDNGLTNTASATSEEVTTPVEDTITTEPEQDPGLTVLKSAVLNDNDGTPGVSAGDTIDYTFKVTNTGNVSLFLPNGAADLNDTETFNGTAANLSSPVYQNNDGGVFPASQLPVGTTATYTASYTLTQADVDRGEVTNRAEVTANTASDGTGTDVTTVSDTETAPDGEVITDPLNTDSDGTGGLNDDPTVVELAQAADATLIKSAVSISDINGDGFVTAGDILNYEFTVTNTGNVTLTDVAVTEESFNGTGGAPTITFLSSTGSSVEGTLVPGETATYVANYTLQQNDFALENGELKNQAKIDAAELSTSVLSDAGTEPDGTPIDDPAGTGTDSDETITALPPRATLIKSAVLDITGGDRDDIVDAGDVITYTYVVENVGAGTLTGVSVNETAANFNGTGLLPEPQFQLNESTGTSLSGDGLEIEPGGKAVFTATYTLTAEDADRGNVTNQAEVVAAELDTAVVSDAGTDSAGNEIIDPLQTDSNQNGIPNDDPTVLSFAPPPRATLIKSVDISDLSEFPQAGETVTYSFTVTNTGETTLENLEIFDPLISSTDAVGTIASLPPGATDSNIQVTYSLTQGDINAGKVENQAFLRSDRIPAPGIPSDTGTDRQGDTIADPLTTDSDGSGETNDDPTVFDIAADPKATLIKSAQHIDTNEDGVTGPGDQIEYTFELKNVGNVNLLNTTIVEESFNGNGAALDIVFVTNTETGNEDIDSQVVPGESVIFQAFYTLVEEDFIANSGQLSNLAKAPELFTPQGVQVDPVLSVAGTDENGDLIITPEATGTEQDPTLYNLPRATLSKQVLRNDADSDTPPAAGQVIEYRYLILNPNLVTLTDVQITESPDDFSGDFDNLSAIEFAGQGSFGDIEAGGFAIYRATYTLTQEDIDRGFVENQARLDTAEIDTAIVSDTFTNPDGTDINDGAFGLGTDSSGDGTLNNDPTRLDLEAVGALDVVKTATLADTNSSGADDEGDTITYTITARNTGNVTLSNVAVADTLYRSDADNTDLSDNTELTLTSGPTFDSADQGSSEGTLKPGETATYTATYVLEQDDVDAGGVVNTAVVSSETPDGTKIEEESGPTSETDGATATSLTQEPGLSLAKTADTSALSSPAVVGEEITYTFEVENTGNVTLTNVAVNDPLPDLSEPVFDAGLSTAADASSVAPGETAVFTATYALKQSDIDNGLTNTASATSEEVTTPVEDTITTSPEQAPALTLAKTADTSALSSPAVVGEEITYTFEVENTGNVTLNNVAVDDPLPDLSEPVFDDTASTATDASLVAPGETAVFTATYALKQSDIDNGLTNTASATSEEVTTPVEDTITTSPEQAPALTLAKTADTSALSSPAVVGEEITYTFEVENTGNVTLTNVAVDDPLPDLSEPVFDDTASTATDASLVAPGETAVFTATYALKQSDIDNGLTNTASATSEEVTTPVEDTITTSPEQAPALTLAKTADTSALSSPAVVGEEITYTFEVENTGNVTLNNIVVNDPLIDASNPVGTITSLLPGATDNSVTATYILTQDDINNGSVVNTATATSAEVTDEVSSNEETVSYDVLADLSIAKVVDNATPNVGEQVVFTLTASNAGPSDATGVVVTDELPSGYTYVSDNGSEAYDETTGEWTIGDLANGASETLEITVTVNATGDFGNVASIDGEQMDPSTENNETPAVKAEPLADLSVSKSVDKETANVGETVVFAVTASNFGPSDANDVIVEDLLPSGYVFVSSSVPSGTTYDPATGIWDIGFLPGDNTTRILTITAEVQPTGDYGNVAEISGDTPADPNENNNKTDPIAPANLVQQSDLALTKAVSDDKPKVGDEIVFTLVATNNGPSDANAANVKVTDELPSGYTYVSSAATDGSYDESTGIWDIGSLAKDQEETLEITVLVNASGDYANVASIEGDEADPDLTNNTTPAVEPEPTPVSDLSITKVVDNATPNVGDTVTFTLTAENDGPSDATGVVVTEQLEDGYEFTKATPSVGSYDPATGEWSIGALANAGSATLTLEATVLASGTYTNTASITGNEEDPSTENNVIDPPVETTPVAQSDLSIAKVVDNATPNVGEQVVFTLTASNAGPSDATGVVVTDELPSGYTYVSDNGGSATSESNGEITWTIGDLANGADPVELAITVTVNATGDYGNTASIEGNEEDPSTENNVIDPPVETTPVAQSDLSIAKVVDNATPNVGEQVVFTLTASNAGPSDATGVVVTDELPSGYTYVSDNGSEAYDETTGEWTIGDLANGASETLEITVTVNATGDFGNVASIDGEQMDPSTENNETPAVKAEPLADLSVSKSVDKETANVGETVVFAVTASNFGPSDANDVIVEDLLPSGYVFVSSSVPSGTTYDPATGIWDIGFLPGDNTTRILTITAEVQPTGDYGNVAEISGDTPADPNENNNKTDPIAPANLVQQSDLALTKAVSDDKPKVGDEIVFTLVATNNGPSDANAANVKVTDELPSGYTYVSSAATDGSYDESTGIWDIGSLAKDQEETLEITVLVNASGDYANVASIEGDEADPDLTNNTTPAVEPEPTPVSDLSITKVVDNATPNVGDTVTFTLTAENDGPSDATGVVVTEQLEDGYEFTKATPSVGSYDPATGEWSIGALANAGSATLTLEATVLASGTYTNTASITGNEEDPSTENNVIDPPVETTPVAQSDLSIAKVVDNATPNVGEQVVFTLTASNAGPSDATGVVVTDELPSGYTYVSDNGGSATSESNGEITWTIGDLANGADPVELAITVTVNATGDYGNTASIEGNEEDPSTENNVIDPPVETTPVAQSDLSIAKVVDNATPNVGEQVVFTLTASNAGPSDATGVVVTDELPSGYTYVSDNGSEAYDETTGEWTIGDLANGASETLEITVTVNATGDFGNVASIDGEQMDPSTENNETPAVKAEPLADLSVSKSVDKETANVGETVVFAVTASNFGPSDANDVIVEDLLPSGYVFVSSSVPSGTTYDPATGIWDIGFLPGDNTTRILTITAEVQPTGDYGNVAEISGDTPADPNENNNKTDPIAPANLVQQSDLALTKAVSDDKPKVGDEIVFTLVATNNGPSDANAANVKVTDELPSGYTYVSSAATDGSYDESTGIWDIGSLAKDQEETLEITVLVNASGDYANVASIEGDEADPDLTNNTTPAVEPEPTPVSDLSITKVVDNATPNVGDTVTFTLTAENDGPSDATGVVVTEQLEDGYEFTKATPSVGSYDPATGEWSIGALANAGSATLTLEATVLASGTYTNTASITGNEEDPSTENNVIDPPVETTPVVLPALQDDSVLSNDLGEPVTVDVLGNDEAGSNPIDPASVRLLDESGEPVTELVVAGEGTWTVDETTGEITFTPEAGFTGDPQPVSYTASDDQGNPAAAPGTVSVVYTEAPVLEDDESTGNTPGEPVTVDVLGNDDTSIDPASVRLLDESGEPVTELVVAGEGTWTVDETTGEITFTPEAGFTGDPQPVSYTASDDQGNPAAAPGTVSVVYTEAPVLEDDESTGNTPGEPVTVDVLGNDDTSIDPASVRLLDESGEPVTELVVAGEGTWTVDETTGEITFTPEAGFTGDPQPVSYTASDDQGNPAAAPGTVSVVYTEAPVLEDDESTGNTPGEPVTVDVLGNDDTSIDPASVRLLDESGEPVTELVVAGEGTWTVDETTGEITFTPEAGFTGDPQPVSYTASDDQGNPAAAPGTVSVVYTEAPVLEDDESTGNTPGEPVTVDVLGNDDTSIDPASVRLLDESGEPVTELVVAGEGTWTVDETTGEITFTPEAGFTGDPQPVSYTASDDQGNPAAAPATVSVVYTEALEITKIAGVDSVRVGDLLTYEISIRNSGTADVVVDIVDTLPRGFIYRQGSAATDGVPIDPGQSGQVLRFEGVTAQAGRVTVITLTTYVSTAVTVGTHINRARMFNPFTGAPIGQEATAAVRVEVDPVFQCSTVIGRVFDDINHDGYFNGEPQEDRFAITDQDFIPGKGKFWSEPTPSAPRREKGLPGVRLVTPNGIAVTTDEHGRFSLPCAALPRDIGSNFMLKLDDRTLPVGYRLTTENPRVVRLTPGMLTKMNFGAAMFPVARVDLSARAFSANGEMRPELRAGLQGLVAQIAAKPSVVRLSYQAAPNERDSVGNARLRSVEREIRRLWSGTGRYALTVERVVERAANKPGQQ